ncbi:MAG TPA: hypothetical protein VGO85_19335, partial [Caldimonas sp.]|nr:hypothetical protein [Caldimonas sp.]
MRNRIDLATAAAVALAALAAGCGGGGDPAPAPPVIVACSSTQLANGAADATLALAAWPDRDYDLVLPASHECGKPIAVVIALHGGGSNKEGMRKLACPEGDLA